MTDVFLELKRGSIKNRKIDLCRIECDSLRRTGSILILVVLLINSPKDVLSHFSFRRVTVR